MGWLRLYWVGLYEERCGKNWKWFFHVDLVDTYLVRQSEHTYPCGPRGGGIDANRDAVIQALSGLREMLPFREILYLLCISLVGGLANYLSRLLIKPPVFKSFAQLPNWAFAIVSILVSSIFVVIIMGLAFVVRQIISVAIVFTRRYLCCSELREFVLANIGRRRTL